MHCLSYTGLWYPSILLTGVCEVGVVLARWLVEDTRRMMAPAGCYERPGGAPAACCRCNIVFCVIVFFIQLCMKYQTCGQGGSKE